MPPPLMLSHVGGHVCVRSRHCHGESTGGKQPGNSQPQLEVSADSAHILQGGGVYRTHACTMIYEVGGMYLLGLQNGGTVPLICICMY